MDKKHIIYLIDFGLSKFYETNNEHIEYKKSKGFTGSYRYSSIRNHKGIEQSRRDDLESIGYMLIFFLKGKLPWQGLKGSNKKKKSTNIYRVKRNISIDELCEDLPNEFNEYIKYVRLLKFKEKPDYVFLKNLFVNLLKKNKHTIDNIYDWNLEAIKIKNLIKKDEK